jgi:hypothetical protein
LKSTTCDLIPYKSGGDRSGGDEKYFNL